MNQECFSLLSKSKEKAQSISKFIAIQVIENDDELYLKSLDLIMLLSKLEEKMNSNASENIMAYDDKTTEEINKVKRKIPKWKKNPYQINHKILEAYFKMKKENLSVTAEVFERSCKEYYGNDFSFFTNFSQMHNIAPKNNAKVFEINNGEIMLWKPIKDFVEKVWLNK